MDKIVCKHWHHCTPYVIQDWDNVLQNSEKQTTAWKYWKRFDKVNSRLTQDLPESNLMRSTSILAGDRLQSKTLTVSCGVFIQSYRQPIKSDIV